MPFAGPEVLELLRAKGATNLHHANTVETAVSLLAAGGLLSRGVTQARGLPQTPQASDAADQAVGVWNDVFLDAVDIHERAGKRNVYGPVLFVLNLEVLNWPQAGEVYLTKTNPQDWTTSTPEAEKYYQNRAEFESGYRFGDFNTMLILRGGTQPLPFADFLLYIELDNPNRLVENTNLFNAGRERLAQALANTAIGSLRDVQVIEHSCRSSCRCRSQYSGFDARWVKNLFDPAEP